MHTFTGDAGMLPDSYVNIIVLSPKPEDKVMPPTAALCRARLTGLKAESWLSSEQF